MMTQLNLQKIAHKNLSEWPIVQKTIETIPLTSSQPTLLSRVVHKFSRSKGKDPMFPPGVYIFVYHSVVDPKARQEWEQHYRKGELTLEQFTIQMDILAEWMTHIPLSKVPALWEQGELDKAYFAITFDDGMQNNLRIAHPVIKAHALQPAVFVSAAFAQGMVLYRILVAILVATGGTEQLAHLLLKALPKVPWSHLPQKLFEQTKLHYQAEVMEQCVEQVYQELHGNPAELRVHMSVDEVKQLQQEGWEIGNHTLAHRILSFLTPEAMRVAIEQNELYWQQQGVGLIPFVGYPFGRACDVNQSVHNYLLTKPGMHGILATGGVNLMASQSEWLRFSLGKVDKADAIRDAILKEIFRTKQAFKYITTNI